MPFTCAEESVHWIYGAFARHRPVFRSDDTRAVVQAAVCDVLHVFAMFAYLVVLHGHIQSVFHVLTVALEI